MGYTLTFYKEGRSSFPYEWAYAKTGDKKKMFYYRKLVN